MTRGRSIRSTNTRRKRAMRRAPWRAMTPMQRLSLITRRHDRDIVRLYNRMLAREVLLAGGSMRDARAAA
jgi:hypothetical protein